MYELIVALAFAATLSWLAVDTLSKSYVRKLDKERASAYVLLFGILPMLAFAAFFYAPSANLPLLIAYSVAAGVFLFMGYLLIYMSVSTSGIANSYMLLEIQPPLLICFALLAEHERLSNIQAASMALIFIGAFFIITNIGKGLKLNRLLLPSLLGNASWAVYWMLLIEAMRYGNFATPLLVARLAAAAFGVVYLEAGGKRAKPERKGMPRHALLMAMLIVLAAGLLDGLGNVFFAVVAYGKNVAIGSAIFSMEPILIWLIGVLAYKEHTTASQKLGFAIATIGYVALSLA
ncbi:MAG: EamA family transporter [Candidatus Micrarchaeia archaeon]